MTDLTKITTPFGLLDEATQKALRECGGPWEWYNSMGEWEKQKEPSWAKAATYRLMQPPPKPREWWIVGGVFIAKNDKEVRELISSFAPAKPEVIRVREVLE